MLRPQIIIAACLTLIPFLAAAFFGASIERHSETLPTWVRLLRPAVLATPYALVAWSAGDFRWGWFALYALLPVAVAALLWQAKAIDIAGRGNWRDFLVLAVLGLAVDLRWFEPAWPPHLAVFNKMLLLDAGIYGFLAIRQLDGVGLTFVCDSATPASAFASCCSTPPLPWFWDWPWAFCIFTQDGRASPSFSVDFSSRSFSSPCRKSCSFADGCRTCWNAA